MDKSTFKPFISAEQQLPELTIKAIIPGIFLGIIFGVATVYLGLKVGVDGQRIHSYCGFGNFLF